MNQVLGTGVVLVHWPDEADELARLQADGVPRLLLVPPGARPPVDPDPHTDWIRLPVEDEELWIRVRTLEQRATTLGRRPTLPGDGRIMMGSRWVTVSPIGERLLGPLVEQFGDVVLAEDLVAAAWPDGDDHRGPLRVHIAKIRALIAPLGLTLVVVRERGYVLQLLEPSAEASL